MYVFLPWPGPFGVAQPVIRPVQRQERRLHLSEETEVVLEAVEKCQKQPNLKKESG